MKDCKLFYLKQCPYCKKALSYLDELKKEDKYCGVNIEMIEESEDKEMAGRYDYYFVPCFYVDGKKVSEGAVDRDGVKRVLDKIVD